MKAIRCFVLSVVLAGWLAACGPADGTVIDRMVDIGTHRLRIRCVGSGEPVLVIDTGHGDLAEKWREIQEQLAGESRVCTYDRAGYGRSEPGPMPRHSRQAASELKQLLESAHTAGLYVLVGHSLGGLNVQVFADTYPELVAGLVLVDPSPLDFITGKAFPDLHRMATDQAAALSAAADHAIGSIDPEEKAQAGYLAAIASELQMLFDETAEQVTAIESFGDVPLTVLAAGKPNPAFGEQAEAFQQFWIEQNRELATKAAEGTFVLAQGAHHHLHVDAPDQVIEAVRLVLESAREPQRNGR